MDDTQLKYELKSLALNLYHKHFSRLPDAVPFEPFDDCHGLVSQIDNMTTGMVHESKAAIMPAGYVLVPVEPTKKMINSFWNVVQVGNEARPSDIYKAMIQAAQEEK